MMPGSPWAMCITPGPNQVLYASDAYPGRVFKMTLDGKVLGVLGEAANSSSNSGGFTKWRARPKTCSTSPSC